MDFYAKCADLEASAQLFVEVPYRNCITWGVMISGLIENGHFKEAIELFRQLLAAGVQPIAENMRNLLVVYTHMGALQLGKSVHGYLVRNSFFYSNEGNRSLETSILNMYIRCGSFCAARICFNGMLARDLVTWTSMIEGCAVHGKGFEALELFHQMVEDRIEPNSVTFISLLSACSHSGLLHEGCELLCCMKSRFGIDPDLDHYTCIVDLLGRSGKTKEALAIIVKFVIFPDSRIWGALLAASRVNEDQKLGEYAAERLLQLEPDNVGYHTVFSNVQASAGKWDEVEEARIAYERQKFDEASWVELLGRKRNDTWLYLGR
ncbi:Pentatricopeptide repeat-containing protein [Forsythia ovata]|uniref:Pentatricopeptide repeat-containing protein n=1 Tax=Forsythia ovata TaxID=205694 RepID=A0ABD1PMN5_9LAMI